MEKTEPKVGGLFKLWRCEGQESFSMINPLHYCSWRSFSQSLCSPGAREVEKAVWVGKENWRKLTGMGGALGGADQEPGFLLSTQASSPWLTPTPSSPHSPQEPRVPALLPNPSYPPPSVSPLQGMEAERPQEEENGDQVSCYWVGEADMGEREVRGCGAETQ